MEKTAVLGKTALKALVGICIMLIIELLGAILISKGIIKASIVPVWSLLSVGVGAGISAFLSGGRIKGIIAAGIFVLILFLLGIFFLENDFSVKNAAAVCGMSILGACAAAGVRAAFCK